MSEVRVLLEGASEQARRKAQQRGTSQGSGVHERAPGQARESDSEWVQSLNSSDTFD